MTRNNFLKSAADLAETLVISFFVMMMIFTYIFDVITISGDSMRNTLMPDDRVLVSLFGTPENGDVIIVNAQQAFLLDENNSVSAEQGLHKNIDRKSVV